jgi:hypothetical protein
MHGLIAVLLLQSFFQEYTLTDIVFVVFAISEHNNDIIFMFYINIRPPTGLELVPIKGPNGQSATVLYHRARFLTIPIIPSFPCLRMVISIFEFLA